jgi:hypothetical protein
MFVKLLRAVGVKSGMAHVAGLLSVAISILTWASARSTTDRPSAERLGIFVGLWAPTLILIGNALQIDEAADTAQADNERQVRSAA